jgi:outer membrane protein OmpA-like peptidoglycan-associated protein
MVTERGEFPPNTVRLTACRAGDIEANSEKGGLKCLFSKACTLQVYGINFDFNKLVLRPYSEPVLNQLLALFKSDPAYAAEISGHTDNIGKPDYSRTLSASRADAVKEWVTAHGIAATGLSTVGYGDTKPLVPNTTDENRAHNRRVELKRNECK